MISINLCRISSDKQYLEFNVEATPNNYKFTHLYVWSYTNSSPWVITENTIDLADYLDGNSNKEIKNLPFDTLDLDPNALYYLTFEIEWDGTGEEDEEAELTANAVVVSLTDSYYTKVRWFNTSNNCLDNKDKIIQLSLYENLLTNAIKIERWADANKYFTLIKEAVSNDTIYVTI